MTLEIRLTILGEPASKANSRVLSKIGPKDDRRTILRKGDKALAYEKAALAQIPPRARMRLEGPVEIELRIFYASERPDLDESIVLDVLQDRHRKGTDGARVLVQAGVYRNDRQVRRKVVEWGLDRRNPRTEIVVRPFHAQQAELSLPIDVDEEDVFA